MKKVVVVSNIGGVGRSTLVAHIASQLHMRGIKTCAIDLDPQQLLSLHYGMISDDASVTGKNEAVIRLLSFCGATGSTDSRPEGSLHKTPDQTSDHAKSLGASTCLYDTARLPAHLTQNAVHQADSVLAILVPEPGCYARLAQLQALTAQQPNAAFIINRLDTRQPLQKDILNLIYSELGNQLIFQPIHHDRHFMEAFASGQTLFDYAPDSQAAHDLNGLVNQLQERDLL